MAQVGMPGEANEESTHGTPEPPQTRSGRIYNRSYAFQLLPDIGPPARAAPTFDLNALTQTSAELEDGHTSDWGADESDGTLTDTSELEDGEVKEDVLPTASSLASSRSHRRRCTKRRLHKPLPGERVIRPRSLQNLQKVTKPLATDICLSSLPATTSGYVARNLGASNPNRHNLQVSKLMRQGYRYIKWDGKIQRPLLDPQGRVFGVLAGQPKDPSYGASCKLLYKAFELERQAEQFMSSERNHRRGTYPAINAGVSYGQGQGKPATLVRHEDTKRRLLANPHLQRISSFSDWCFQATSPRLYQYYSDNLNPLFDGSPSNPDPPLTRPFPSSVFPCGTFNFGPQVWTKSHRDSMNLAFGWCAVHALGEFDHTQGGHLVLEDPKMVIEFPSSSCILFPSATISHGNIPIRPGEKRASFTQFASGGLFRWVAYGFQSAKKLEEEDHGTYERLRVEGTKRWENGLNLYERCESSMSVGNDD